MAPLQEGPERRQLPPGQPPAPGPPEWMVHLFLVTKHFRFGDAALSPLPRHKPAKRLPPRGLPAWRLGPGADSGVWVLISLALQQPDLAAGSPPPYQGLPPFGTGVSTTDHPPLCGRKEAPWTHCAHGDGDAESGEPGAETQDGPLPQPSAAPSLPGSRCRALSRWLRRTACPSPGPRGSRSPGPRCCDLSGKGPRRPRRRPCSSCCASR